MSPQRRADLAYFAAILVGVAFIVLMGPLGRRLEMVHSNDFSGIWSGPATVLSGVNPWDPTLYVRTAIALGTKTPDALVDDYMPWEVVALLPLGALPLEVAAWIWMIGSMALSAFALRALLRAFVPGRAAIHGALGLALFVGQPGFHTIILGQWALLLMSAVAAIRSAVDDDPEMDVKRKAVFALSQLPKDEGVPKLMEVARNNRNPEVRKQAMFWLGQSKDPRAVSFFEDLLK